MIQKWGPERAEIETGAGQQLINAQKSKKSITNMSLIFQFQN